MFLHLMRDENKKLFLALTKALCHSDGHFSDDEKEMLAVYCKEMGISDDGAETVSAYADLMDQLAAESDAREKKIIVFELLGLAHVDKDFSEDERRFVDELRDAFGMEADDITRAEQLIRDYLDLQGRLNRFVFD